MFLMCSFTSWSSV